MRNNPALFPDTFFDQLGDTGQNPCMETNPDARLKISVPFSSP